MPWGHGLQHCTATRSAALRCQPPGKDVPRDPTACGHRSSSNATQPPERMSASKTQSFKSCESTRDAGWVPPVLAFQPLSVLPSGRGRCHPPRITTCCYFCLAGICSPAPVFPYTQAQTIPGLNFPTIHQLEKPERSKLLDVATPGEVHEGGSPTAPPKSYRTHQLRGEKVDGSGQRPCGPPTDISQCPRCWQNSKVSLNASPSCISLGP